MRPTTPGLFLLLSLVPLVALAANTPRGEWLCAAGVVLVSTLLALDAALCRRDEVEVAREHEDRVPVGVPATVGLRVRNRGRAPLRLCLRDAPDEELPATDREHRLVLPPGAEERIAYEFTPDRRGVFHFSGCWLERPGRFGMSWRRWKEPITSSLAVIPDIRPLRVQRAGQAALARLRGRHRSRRRGDGAEMESLREAIPGDDPRRMDWKATARRMRLVCRQYELERNRQVVFLLDAGRWMGRPAGKLSKLDHAINATLFSASSALKGGDRVGLLAFSDRIDIWSPPQRGQGALPRFLDRLNALRVASVEPDYLLAFETLAKRLRRRSLMILLSDLSDPATGKELARSLKIITRRHVVLCLDLLDDELEAEAQRPLRNLAEVARRAVMDSLEEERELMRAALRSAGARVVSCTMSELPMTVVDRYLELKGRGLV